MSVTPTTLTVTENQTATFYCSVDGNPKPKVYWSKIDGTGSLKTKSRQNKFDIRNATYKDSGRYVCKATNVLGHAQRSVELFVEGEF